MIAVGAMMMAVASSHKSSSEGGGKSSSKGGGKSSSKGKGKSSSGKKQKNEIVNMEKVLEQCNSNGGMNFNVKAFNIYGPAEVLGRYIDEDDISEPFYFPAQDIEDVNMNEEYFTIDALYQKLPGFPSEECVRARVQCRKNVDMFLHDGTVRCNDVNEVVIGQERAHNMRTITWTNMDWSLVQINPEDEQVLAEETDDYVADSGPV